MSLPKRASLVDFDWESRLIVANSAVSTTNEPVVLLTCRLAMPDGSIESHVLELTSTTLEVLVRACGDANAEMQRGPARP
mmetsp:Transcript_27410/g.73783  ORF Transcript_27410/g.73783 Transcript_27410/m.73783 type:complete len:80 (+) Transcript_27410:79-318(+)